MPNPVMAWAALQEWLEQFLTTGADGGYEPARFGQRDRLPRKARPTLMAERLGSINMGHPSAQ
jgi:hypothetical protein